MDRDVRDTLLKFCDFVGLDESNVEEFEAHLGNGSNFNNLHEIVEYYTENGLGSVLRRVHSMSVAEGDAESFDRFVGYFDEPRGTLLTIDEIIDMMFEILDNDLQNDGNNVNFASEMCEGILISEIDFTNYSLSEATELTIQLLIASERYILDNLIGEYIY